MSYYPKKEMFLDDAGVARFRMPGTAVMVQTKRWHRVERYIKVLDSKGELLKKSRQQAEVYAYEDTAVGMAMRQLPWPWPGKETEGHVEETIRILESNRKG